jgi:hypothetical protein
MVEDKSNHSKNSDEEAESKIDKKKIVYVFSMAKK